MQTLQQITLYLSALPGVQLWKQISLMNLVALGKLYLLQLLFTVFYWFLLVLWQLWFGNRNGIQPVNIQLTANDLTEPAILLLKQDQLKINIKYSLCSTNYHEHTKW